MLVWQSLDEATAVMKKEQKTWVRNELRCDSMTFQKRQRSFHKVQRVPRYHFLSQNTNFSSESKTKFIDRFSHMFFVHNSHMTV